MKLLRLALTLVCFALPTAAFANSTVWVQLDLGNEALVPERNDNFSITSGFTGEQYTDENGDSQIDTAKLTWSFASLPTDITVTFLLTSTYAVDSITARQISSGNLVEEVIDANSITFTLDNNSDTLVKIRLTGPREPVSFLLIPEANTLTGTPVLWGQAYHAAQRALINPRDTAYPANLFNGEVTEKVVDLHVKGRGLDFVWSRRYRSGGFEDSALGNNWVFSYNIFVEGPAGGFPNRRAIVHMGNARKVLFKQTGFSGFLDFFFADGWEARLIDDTDTGEITLEFGNGTVWLFTNGGVADGKIESIADRYGNTLSFTYNGTTGRLQTITDTLGRNYAIAYDANGFIDSLTESNGLSRVVDYVHYGASEAGGSLNDLKTVTYPPITGTVTGNNFPSGRSLTYTYDKTVNSPKTGDLLTITDGRGNTVLTNVYDSSSRVITQTWGSDGATDAVVSFDYPASPTGLMGSETQKTIVNDGEGNVTEFFYNATNQLLRILEYTGRAVPNLVTTQTANRPANKLRSTDPATYQTSFTWNIHDLLTQRTNPSGNRVVFTYGNAGVRTRISEMTQIQRFNPGSTQSLRENFVYKNDWSGDNDKFTGCRCGEAFVTQHTMTDEGSNVDFRIAFRFDDSGNRTGISYGALTGFPSTFHETFGYNSFGQLTSRTHPDNDSGYNRQDTYAYFTTAPKTGYLQTVLADAATLSLRTTYDVDAVGNVVGVTPPKGHSGSTPLSAHQTILIYNSNDELIRRRSREPSTTVTNRNEVDFIYDANGNITSRLVDNRNELGIQQANADWLTTFQYDSLNRTTQIVREIEGFNVATTQVAYTRNGLPRLVSLPEAVAGNQPNDTQHILYDERDLTFKTIRGFGDKNQLSTQFDYDVNGNLVKQTAGLEEAAGNRRATNFAPDGFDRLDTVTDPLGNVTGYAYNGAGQIENITVREGGTTLLSDVDYIYDLSGRNTQINRAFLDSSGVVISGTVNGVATGDGAANTVMTYTDAFDLLTIAFEGNTTTRAYDTANRVSTVTDPKSNVVTYTYDANSNVTILDETAANDLGGTQAFQTRFVYDQLDRLTQRRLRYSTASGGLFNDTSFAYDSRNNLVFQTDARGNDSTFAYDGLNRRTAETYELSPGGATVATGAVYDLNSRLTQRTDPKGNATQYRYDALDRLTDIIYADGTRDVQTYNRFGNPATRTDPAGTVFTTTYDKLSRLTGRTTTAATGFSSPGTETLAYDALSRLTTAQDADSLVTLDHDSLGNIQTETLQIDGGTTRTTSHTYDDNGNRKRTAYPGGRVLTFTHDTRERLDAITDATGSPFTLANYDYVGSRVARRTYNANGTQLDYTYDGIGSANPAGDFGFKRIIGTAHTVTSGGAVRDQRTYLWDRDHNKLQREDVRSGGPLLTHDYTYDGRSRLLSADDGTTLTSFTYDAAGNRMNTGYVQEGADAALNNYTETPLDDRGYDLLGNLGSFDARDRWYTFDAQSRLTGYVLAGTRSVDDFSSGIPGAYTVQSGTWSVTDEVLSETSAATGRILRTFPTGTQEFNFSYRSPHGAGDTSDFDPERYGLAILRLLEPDSPAEWRYVALVIEPTGLYLREWEDDVLVAEHDSADVTAEADTWYDVKVAYSGTNNTTIAVSWAKRGQPFEEVLSGTVTLAEDAAQELGFGVGQLGDYEFRNVIFRDTTADTSTTQVTYEYDALGRRIARTVDPDGTPVRTEFYYDGPQIVEERNGAGSVEATYVYGRYVDEVLSMQRGADDYYYHQDDLHNVMAVTDDTGTVLERYEYGEFGEPSFFDGSGSSIGGTAIGNEFLFTGRQYDADTGLYHYRSRYMDPQAGRFISRDTIGLYGDAANLGNGQAYVGNNPWTRIDPYGFYSWGEFYDEHISPEALRFKAGVVANTFVGAGKALYGFGELSYTLVGGAIHAYTGDEFYAGFETGYNQIGVGLYAIGTHPIRTTSEGIRGFQDEVTRGLIEGDAGAVGQPIGSGSVHGLVLGEGVAGLSRRAVARSRGSAAGSSPSSASPITAKSALPAIGEQLEFDFAASYTVSTSVEGSFSIANWAGYPAGVPRPVGPFRLLSGEEYAVARRSADNANRSMHRQDPTLAGMHIHEIQPVKFGGRPTDPANKIVLSPTEHEAVTLWWRNFQASLEGRQ